MMHMYMHIYSMYYICDYSMKLIITKLYVDGVMQLMKKDQSIRWMYHISFAQHAYRYAYEIRHVLQDRLKSVQNLHKKSW